MLSQERPTAFVVKKSTELRYFTLLEAFQSLQPPTNTADEPNFRYRRPKGGTQSTNTLYTVGELSCRLETASTLTGEGAWSEVPDRWNILDDRTDNLDGTETVTCRTLLDGSDTLS